MLVFRAQTNGLNSQTISVLKPFCKEMGLAISGKKEDLVARINFFMSERTVAEDAKSHESA